MKKICFVSDYFIRDPEAAITGPMVQTYLLGKELQSRGWEVHFVAYKRRIIHAYQTTYERLNIHWLPQRRFFPLLNCLWILREMGQINADFYYQRGRDILTGITSHFCKKNRKRFIWASSGDSGVERTKYANQLKRKNRPFLIRILLHVEARVNDAICEYGIENADRIIVQTEYQANRLEDTFDRQSIIIGSGHPVVTVIERNLPFKVLWIGNIKRIKRPELYIELAQMCKDLDCEFWMAGQIGDQNLWQLLEPTIRDLKNFRFLGPIPFAGSQQTISHAHVLINTTDQGYEGLPNAFVQAWLTGTVTLSLNCDPDGIIEREGIGKKFSSIGEAKRLVNRMLNEPLYWKTLSHNAQVFGQTNFDIKNIVDRVEQHLVGHSGT